MMPNQEDQAMIGAAFSRAAAPQIQLPLFSIFLHSSVLLQLLQVVDCYPYFVSDHFVVREALVRPEVSLDLGHDCFPPHAWVSLSCFQYPPVEVHDRYLLANFQCTHRAKRNDPAFHEKPNVGI